MKKLLLNVVAALLTVCGMSALASMSPAAYADGAYYCVATNTYVSDLSECDTFADNPSNKADLMGVVNTIINVIIGIVGFVAVIMMIMGGISFITSQGDSAKVTKARNTILYGVVGLVVALLAFAIVNFVLKSVFNGTGAGDTQQVEGDV